MLKNEKNKEQSQASGPDSDSICYGMFVFLLFSAPFGILLFIIIIIIIIIIDYYYYYYYYLLLLSTTSITTTTTSLNNGLLVSLFLFVIEIFLDPSLTTCYASCPWITDPIFIIKSYKYCYKKTTINKKWTWLPERLHVHCGQSWQRSQYSHNLWVFWRTFHLHTRRWPHGHHLRHICCPPISLAYFLRFASPLGSLYRLETTLQDFVLMLHY